MAGYSEEVGCLREKRENDGWAMVGYSGKTECPKRIDDGEMAGHAAGS